MRVFRQLLQLKRLISSVVTRTGARRKAIPSKLFAVVKLSSENGKFEAKNFYFGKVLELVRNFEQT